jgi:hypothetical protein
MDFIPNVLVVWKAGLVAGSYGNQLSITGRTALYRRNKQGAVIKHEKV